MILALEWYNIEPVTSIDFKDNKMILYVPFKQLFFSKQITFSTYDNYWKIVMFLW